MRPKAFAMKFQENAREEWLEKCFLWLPAGTGGHQRGLLSLHVGEKWVAQKGTSNPSGIVSKKELGACHRQQLLLLSCL